MMPIAAPMEWRNQGTTVRSKKASFARLRPIFAFGCVGCRHGDIILVSHPCSCLWEI